MSISKKNLTKPLINLPRDIASTSLRDKFIKYRLRYDIYCAWCNATDSIAIGREPTKGEWARHEQAENDLLHAEKAVLLHRDTSIDDLRVRVDLIRHDAYLSEAIMSEVDTFLTSLASENVKVAL